jgi:cytoskeletal protein RodZ
MAKEKNKTETPLVLEGELQARLVKIREEAGYTTAQMADAMCLSEEVIVNLENEAFDLLAEPPYVRGYLRNYAKISETDPSELINRYEALRGADINELNYKIKTSSHKATSSRNKLTPILMQLILLAFLLGGIALLSMIPGVNAWLKNTWENFTSQLQTSNLDTPNNPLLTGTMPVPIPLPETEEQETLAPETVSENVITPQLEIPKATESTLDTTSTSEDTQAQTKTIPSLATTPEKAEDTDQNTTETQTASSESAQVASTDLGNTIKIKLIFNKEVWLRIKNKDNKTVFEGLNESGTDKSLEFEKPLTFRVGNAQGLSLFVDDKAVDISKYINGSVANFTLE